MKCSVEFNEGYMLMEPKLCYDSTLNECDLIDESDEMRKQTEFRCAY